MTTSLPLPLLILAGGRATRLAHHSDDRPKFLMPLGPSRVFADVQLRWVAAQGFTEVVLSVGYRADMVRAHVGDGARYGLRVRYAEDGATPLGTGGALKRAFPQPPPQVGVLYGDTMLELDCRAVVAAAAGAHALMTVCPCPRGEQANAQLLPDGSARYEKKTPDPSWTQMDYGFSVLSAGFLTGMSDGVPLDLAVPLAQASREGRLRGYLATAPFHEINTPQALEAFRARFGQD